MAAVLTTIYAEVVKTAAIRNRWYGAHACQARFCVFALANLASLRLRWESLPLRAGSGV